MQIVALRAANNAEIPVPHDDHREGDRVRAAPARTRPGGFGYSGPAQGPQTSAAGILSLQLLGQYDDPTSPRRSTYLARRSRSQWGGGNAQYFYYFHYYAIQAHYQAGGKEWNDWHPQVRELLLAQAEQGRQLGRAAGTAEAERRVGRRTRSTRPPWRRWS